MPLSCLRSNLAAICWWVTLTRMSFEAIEREIVTWDDAKLRKLQALAVALRVRQDDPTFAEKMAHRINDQSPERWVTLEEFDRRLGLPSDE